MLIDSHIHVGQYYQFYFSPTRISQLINDVGVDRYLVSSTTMCEENYPKVIDEITKLIELDGNKVLPMMWITPEGLKGNIAWFLESAIKWRCLKIHPFLHPNDWNPKGEQFREVIDIAKELDIPILIHTGTDECCVANKYEELISNNPNVIFILAHGRPLTHTLLITQNYDNAYADSAFMPIEEINKFVCKNLSHKLLWGTDMCIPQYFFPKADMKTYYLNKLSAFKNICSPEEFNNVTFKNACKIFNINPNS